LNRIQPLVTAVVEVLPATEPHHTSTWTLTAGFLRLGPAGFDGNMTSLRYQLCWSG